MIRVGRPYESPYSRTLLEQGMAVIASYYDDFDRDARAQRRSPAETLWPKFIAPAREALMSVFRGKCAYCESPIGATSSVEIDHFRPKLGATDLSGASSPEHYAWLMFEWHNHFPSCPACNRAKRSIFPVKGRRAEPMTPFGDMLQAEDAELIDPCRDEPAEHLLFSSDGLVRAITARGETTIKVLNLNRSPLVIERQSAYQQTTYLLEADERGNPLVADRLTSLDQPYMAMVRLAMAEYRGVSRPPPRSFAVPEERRAANEVMVDAEAFRLNARSLSRVEVVNFKSLRDVKLEFAEQTGESAPWLMLLGENAAGKSSVLQAIGLGLAGASEASRFTRPSKVLTRGTDAGFVRLTFFDKDVPTELRFRRGNAEFGGTADPSAIVVGFGALRYAEARRSRRVENPVTRFAKLAPLLQPVARIPHPAAWLASLDEVRFEAAALALRQILPIGNDSDIVRRGGRILFRVAGHEAPVLELSAGYQTIVGMACAIMRMLFERWESLASAAGIVLVDELDAHLHPRWKMRIVSSLRQAFPQVQFVASTHDPLVLRGIRNAEVAVLRREEGLGTVVDQNLPPIEGMQVEDLLTSRHFGLDSLLDPEVEARLTELYHLQSLPRSADTGERIAQLRAGIGDREALGRNRREQLALLATDELLLELPRPDGSEAGKTISKATAARLQSLLDVTRRDAP